MLLLPLLGGSLLVLLMLDAFATVFFPHGRGGFLTRRQNQVMWAFFGWAGRRRDGSVRDRWLSLAGPAMVVATLTLWVLWLVLAYAVIYYPWMDSFLVSPGSLRGSWWEAVYYSGFTAATLGTGDIVADHQALRVLAPVQAFGGYALLSGAITYYLAVYRELIRKRALAASIAGYFVEGPRRILEYASGGGADAVARWGEAVANELAAVQLAHYQYPVLHYFRSPEPARTLSIQLEHLLELRRRLRGVGADGRLGGLARHPSYLGLQHSVEEYIREVEALFVPERVAQTGERDGDEVERAQQRLLHFMLQGRAAKVIAPPTHP